MKNTGSRSEKSKKTNAVYNTHNQVVGATRRVPCTKLFPLCMKSLLHPCLVRQNRFLKSSIFVLVAVLSWAVPAAASDSSGETSPKIEKFRVSKPFFPFKSHGDLWLTTWAEDGSVFTSWGDGYGPEYGDETKFSHHGLARLTGDLPEVDVEVVRRFMPLSDDDNNSKPTSLLAVGDRLYAAIHSPLLTPDKGFIAYSDDYGKTFHYDLETARTKERNPNFICLIFINMGKAYGLNEDGYVYAFGVPGEINTTGKVYLSRMPRDGILDESTWEYLEGTEEGEPRWSADWHGARPLPGLSSQSYSSMFPNLLFSSAYHPGIGRYIALTATSVEGKLYEAPEPWGPWTCAGNWFRGKKTEWYASYMPGIFTKGMGEDTFYFTAAGRTEFDPRPGDRQYALKIGMIKMKIAEKP